jgi:signal transduction histidine kinase
MTTRNTATIIVVAVGLAIAIVIAVVAGVPVNDTAILVLATTFGSALATAIGALIVRRFRGRPVRAQALVVALSSLLVTVSGVVVAALAMFISTHDLVALFVVMVVAAAVAIGAAVQLGSDIGAGARQVGAFAQTMTGETSITGDAVVTGPGELASLVEELANVSGRLDESRRRERALESSRRELIAWVSHDLRSPLATIRAMAEALDDRVADDDLTIRRYHAQIRSDVERLTSLVDDLFELSRINSGSLPVDRELAGLADVVTDALADARARAEVKGVTVIDRIASLPAVDVSAREFARALNNLLDNAIRHTPPGGQVVVDAQADHDGAMLRVVDECGGIPEPDLSRVFDIAFRGDGARGKDERGGGLGLAIAKGLVEAHDGTVDVANHDRGCLFTVWLPAPP